jgi:hypothetical protein
MKRLTLMLSTAAALWTGAPVDFAALQVKSVKL